MEWKWNHIKIDGNNNLVLQDIDGNMTTIAINAFIEKFTNELKEEIHLLYGRLSDKEKIETLSDIVREQLQDELKKAIDAKAGLENRITTLLEEFKNKDISTTDSLYQEAFSLFMNGKLDEALVVLDDAKLDERAQEVKNEQRQVAETFLLKAQLLQLTFAFEKAAKNFEKAITIFPDRQTYLTAANFYAYLNDYKKAEPLYKKALLLAEKPQERATTLNNLAILQKAKNDYGTAEEGYKEALAVYRQLAETNPQTYLPDVAMTLNNLAVLQSHQNDYGTAEEGYKEALAVYRQLAETNPQTYLPDVATTLNNLAILQKAKNDYGTAEEGYKEALAIRRQLAETNPQTYLPYVATTLNNLANLQSDQNDYGTAEDGYKEALAVYRQLAETNPQTYLPYVATTLNNLANLQSDQNDYGTAEDGYKEALAIRRQLAETNPQTYLPDVAGTLINVGIYYHDAVPDQHQSLACITEALNIILPLIERLPNTKKYAAVAFQVLVAWGINPEEFIRQL
ncbi:tetratricopeptide repeat protein [Chlorobium sp. BLA1]|uniref:tetratricopeptide repeat protein n=1 Tax=Candidatus Chlorobium masyuteum TaxID=2716876 RepID=UPI001420A8F2|nr:tetratricopeptide repeat protein [Candidatus Chlorobium masyuteum]NHQ60588.1 tetratricopeptide repeat protein [Candidatus Chlorobium masyuteum]